MKQCCLCGKKKKGKEKSYYFTHPEQGSTNSNPHLNQREKMGHEKKGAPYWKNEIKKKKTKE